MKYYIALTEEEIERVCRAYPYRVMLGGFKKCSKDFSAIMPGRRPQSVSEEVGRNLLLTNPHANLTAKMIEVLLTDWIKNITEVVKKQTDAGKALDAAYISAFSRFILPGCMDLYFRFCNIEISEEHVLALAAGVDALIAERESKTDNTKSNVDRKKLEELEEKYKKELRAEKAEAKEQAAKVKELTKNLDAANDQIFILTECSAQIEPLQRQISEAAETISRKESENDQLQQQLTEMRALYEGSQKKLNELGSENAEIQEQLTKCATALAQIEEEKKRLSQLYYRADGQELRPADMEEFREYLSYNLVNIGLDTSKQYYPLLLSFLADELFKNQPIVCNHSLGITLASCISNCLCGNSNPLVVPYTQGITDSDIRSILSTDHRVLVLESFLGNYNELELLPLLRGVSGKMIFLTVEYDKTIIYLLPTEALCNCTYVNTNHIPQLLQNHTLDEDPSIISEEMISPNQEQASSRMKRLCGEIMRELGFPPVVTELISSRMVSEQKLISALVFSILPYAEMTLDCSPYNKSPRLQKYAGETGKCPNKALLMEWFGDE